MDLEKCQNFSSIFLLALLTASSSCKLPLFAGCSCFFGISLSLVVGCMMMACLPGESLASSRCGCLVYLEETLAAETHAKLLQLVLLSKVSCFRLAENWLLTQRHLSSLSGSYKPGSS